VSVAVVLATPPPLHQHQGDAVDDDDHQEKDHGDGEECVLVQTGSIVDLHGNASGQGARRI
jgi:hypothetical protein